MNRLCMKKSDINKNNNNQNERLMPPLTHSPVFAVWSLIERKQQPDAILYHVKVLKIMPITKRMLQSHQEKRSVSYMFELGKTRYPQIILYLNKRTEESRDFLVLNWYNKSMEE